MDEFYPEESEWYRQQLSRHRSHPDPSDPDYEPHPDLIIEYGDDDDNDE
jgi:hypothetical protein